MAKNKVRVLGYTYTSLFGKYEYETTLKGKTITARGRSTINDFEFEIKMIDTGEALENVERIDAKIKSALKKFKKQGNIKNLLKYDLIKEVYDSCDKKSKFMNNFSRLGSTAFMFKKRQKDDKFPDDSLNYYFVNGVFINKHKREIKKFLKNIENDRITNCFDGALLKNDKYYILRVNGDSTFTQHSIVSNMMNGEEFDEDYDLTDNWNKYLQRIGS